MLWVIVFAAIAVAGLVVVGCYVVWLLHKTADVWSEVTVLTDRGTLLAELLGEIGAPAGTVVRSGSGDLVLSPGSAHFGTGDVR